MTGKRSKNNNSTNIIDLMLYFLKLEKQEATYLFQKTIQLMDIIDLQTKNILIDLEKIDVDS